MSTQGDALEAIKRGPCSTQLSKSFNNFVFGVVLLLITVYFIWTRGGSGKILES